VTGLAAAQQAVATDRMTAARRAGALPARLDRARRPAAVAGGGIAVVALLAPRHDAVAADRRAVARLAATGPTGLDGAEGATAVAGEVAAVVAALVRLDVGI